MPNPLQPPTPSASVIIPVKDDLSRLKTCVDRLLQPSNAAVIRDLLIVDNGSQPPLQNVWPQEPRLQVLFWPTGGSYAARNHAIPFAQGDVLAFTDSDCLPAPDWLPAGLHALQQSQAGIVAGRIQVFPADPRHPTPVECYEMLYAFPQESYVRRHRFGVTANLLAQRSVFDAVGPFDATLMSGGDSEWGRRASASGHRLEYAPHCVIHHPARRDWKELATKLERTVAGRAALKDHTPSLIAEGGSWSVIRRIAACLLKQRTLPLRQRVAAATVIWKVDRTIRTAWNQAHLPTP